jgi:FixJ family two-component response regulator
MNRRTDHNEATVFVVDDDAAVRQALSSLIRSVGLAVEAFSSAKEFLQVGPQEGPHCLVLDVRLPGISGLDFQTELERMGKHIPIIFMTGHGDIPMTVKAMKGGAVEFLTKPIRDQDLLDAIRVALDLSSKQREKDESLAKIQANFQLLTNREQEVIMLVASGLMNKQIAAKLDVSEITVKVHRGNVMRKMGAKSLAQLVRMVDALGLQKS